MLDFRRVLNSEYEIQLKYAQYSCSEISLRPLQGFLRQFQKKPIRVARAAIKLKISGQAMGRIVKLSYWLSGHYNK